MKTFIFLMLLLVATAVGQAQEITQLEEAKVGFSPLDAKITQVGDSYSYKVKEAYTGEFLEDPIAFMKANFDIKNFMAETAEKNYDSYLVNFSCSKGFLEANYNSEGELIKTHQKFKDILLPHEVRQEVYRNNVGWTVTANKYVASGKGDMLDKQLYRVKLEKGNQKRVLKIDPREIGTTSVASNE